jgi:hypothetical protein
MKAMKRVTTLAFLATAGLAAFTAEARTPTQNQAIYTAQYLESTLVDLADAAEHASYDAARYGDRYEASVYADIADSADTLAEKVMRSVLIPLQQGQSSYVVKAQLQRIESAFQILKHDADALRYLDYDVEDLVLQVDYLKHDLLDVLSTGDRGRPGRDDGRDTVIVR